jgi:hypothetical protein
VPGDPGALCWGAAVHCPPVVGGCPRATIGSRTVTAAGAGSNWRLDESPAARAAAAAGGGPLLPPGATAAHRLARQRAAARWTAAGRARLRLAGWGHLAGRAGAPAEATSPRPQPCPAPGCGLARAAHPQPPSPLPPPQAAVGAATLALMVFGATVPRPWNPSFRTFSSFTALPGPVFAAVAWGVWLVEWLAASMKPAPHRAADVAMGYITSQVGRLGAEGVGWGAGGGGAWLEDGLAASMRPERSAAATARHRCPWPRPLPLPLAPTPSPPSLPPQVFMALDELGIPDALRAAGGRALTATEITAAAAPQADPQWVERLMRAAAAYGFVKRRRMHMTPAGARRRAGARARTPGPTRGSRRPGVGFGALILALCSAAAAGRAPSCGPRPQTPVPCPVCPGPGARDGGCSPTVYGYSLNALSATLCTGHPCGMNHFVGLARNHYMPMGRLGEVGGKGGRGAARAGPGRAEAGRAGPGRAGAGAPESVEMGQQRRGASHYQSVARPRPRNSSRGRAPSAGSSAGPAVGLAPVVLCPGAIGGARIPGMHEVLIRPAPRPSPRPAPTGHQAQHRPLHAGV